jgi:hypothetical protein
LRENWLPRVGGKKFRRAAPGSQSHPPRSRQYHPPAMSLGDFSSGLMPGILSGVTRSCVRHCGKALLPCLSCAAHVEAVRDRRPWLAGAIGVADRLVDSRLQVERKIGEWSARLEYDYLGFGRHDVVTPDAVPFAMPDLRGIAGSSAPDSRTTGVKSGRSCGLHGQPNGPQLFWAHRPGADALEVDFSRTSVGSCSSTTRGSPGTPWVPMVRKRSGASMELVLDR